MTKGDELEKLIASIERAIAPTGLTITVNRKVYDDAGNQLAEFDIEVSGKFGSASIEWLIECRDRPSEGAAPGSWIEQLIGRRLRFKHHKITAVSTSGFSPSAIDCANAGGIELREVRSTDPHEFDWVSKETIPFFEQIHNLKQATINVHESSITSEQASALNAVLAASNNLTTLLGDSNYPKLSLMQLFIYAADQLGLWENAKEKSPGPLTVQLNVQAPENAPMYVHTQSAAVLVGSIMFEGTLIHRQHDIRLEAVRYSEVGSGGTISEIIKFDVPNASKPITVELRKLNDTQMMQMRVIPLLALPSSESETSPL